jgi:hypothetical protein
MGEIGKSRRSAGAWRLSVIAATSVLALTAGTASAAARATPASLRGEAARAQAERVGIDINNVIENLRRRLPPSIPLVGERHYPAVAFDGTNYLVAWSDSRSGSYDIYGA